MSSRTELSFCKAKLRVCLRLVDISTVLELILLINEELIWIFMIMLLILYLNPDRMMLLFEFLLIHAILRILSVFWRRQWYFLLIFWRIINFYSYTIRVRAWRHCLRSLLIYRAFVLVSCEDLLLRNCWIYIVWNWTHVIIGRDWIWSPNESWDMRNNLALLLMWQSWHTSWLISRLISLRH
jgi:hypothetical protein